MKTIVLLIALLIPSVCVADDWTTTDTVMAVASSSLRVVDWLQTIKIARNSDRYYEVNPVLGKHPSEQTVNIYMATRFVSDPIIAYFLPKDWRMAFQGFNIGVSTTCVSFNFKIGLKP